MAHGRLMNGPWRIQIFDQKRLVYSGEITGPVELGRQGDGDEAVFQLRDQAGRTRLVIASRDEDSVSRRHALLEPSEAGARVTNLSAKVPIRLREGPEVRPGESVETPLPTAMMLGRKLVRVQGAMPIEHNLEYLREATLPPGSALATVMGLPGPASASDARYDGGLSSPEVESLVRWLRASWDEFQVAEEPCDFYQGATRALVENIGLDSCRALVLGEQGAWTVSASWPEALDPKGDPWRPSNHILGRLLSERRTVWSSPRQEQEEPDTPLSLTGLSAVVAAPILNHHGEMVGALYGERRRQVGTGLPARTTRVDAMLVELLACAVASGLNRLEQERAAVAAHVQFEQFFTPELARVLAERPEMLKGQDAEITVLFCDIRGFSRISHHVETTRVVAWIGDVMSTLSDCVQAHQGVLVDYIGDELMAMWGAPEEQPDHARLACLAALAMLDQLPGLNARWESMLGEPMDLGIGLNTGMARVGNTGSSQKFKYGPLGNTVNLASRVQGATKYLKARLLATRATIDRLGVGLPSRRLGLVRMVNIDDPVDLLELATPGLPAWETLRFGYETALAEFEAQRFRQATRILGNLVLDHPDDGPSLVLLSRVVNCLIDPQTFDPVYVTPGK